MTTTKRKQKSALSPSQQRNFDALVAKCQAFHEARERNASAASNEKLSDEQMWGRRTHIPMTDPDVPKVVACCNRHRETCIRVMVGRKKTAYIPLQPSGLHVIHCGHDAFNSEWSVLVEHTPQQAAQSYLSSMAATYYISEKARSILEEISLTGTYSTTIQENDMTTANTKSTKTTKPASKAAKPASSKASGAKGAKSDPKGTKLASKKPATAKAQAKPAKPAAKSSKPASKASKAAKPAATRSPYAGMKIKALVQETGAREGSIRHLLRKAVLKATDVDTLLTKTVEFNGEEHPITGTVISNMVNLGMIKVS